MRGAFFDRDPQIHNREEAIAKINEQPYCGFSGPTLDSLGVTECYECGALVTFDRINEHYAWHEALALLLGGNDAKD